MLQTGFKSLKITFGCGFLFLQTILQTGFERLKIVLQTDFEGLDVAFVRRLQFLEIVFAGQTLMDQEGMLTGENFSLRLGHAHPGQAFDKIVGIEGGDLHKR